MTATPDPYPVDRMLTIIAGNIKRERHRQCITQARLADAIGVTPALIGRLECGEQILSMSALARVADVLDVAPCSLLMTESERKAWLNAMDGTTAYSRVR